MSLQTAYTDGSTIAEVVKQEPVTITQASTAASNYLLRVNNSGTGRSLQIDNSGAAYALVLRQFGAGNCVAIGQKSTSIHNVLELENSGSGRTVQVLHSTGSGNVIDITNSGSGTDIKIDHKNTGSAPVITLTNSGTGNDVTADNWSISKAGYATFEDVNVCSGLGRVHAYNTAYAGGRVHIYSRAQEVHKDIHCEWGMDRIPIGYGQSNPFGLYGMVDLYFAYELYCPIVNIQTWFPAYYNEEAADAPDWEFGYPSGQGNKTIEPSILGYIPGEVPGCVAGVHLAFSQCVWGIPSASYQSEFMPGEYDYPEDLLFDFQVLGCECEAEPV